MAPYARGRFPNLSNLSIALLEHLVEPILGRDAIRVVKEPYLRHALEESLALALAETERKLTVIYQNTDAKLLEATLDVSMDNVSSIQQAIIDFYDRPADPTLPNILKEQFRIQSPNADPQRVAEIADAFLWTLERELFNAIPEMRTTLSQLATLEQRDLLRQILERIGNYETSRNSLGQQEPTVELQKPTDNGQVLTSSEIQELADLVLRSGRAEYGGVRRTLCIRIGIEPMDLSYVYYPVGLWTNGP